MKIIWKEKITTSDIVHIRMPEGAEVVKVDSQGGEVRIWYLCDPEAGLTDRYFRLVGTGHPIEYEEFEYVGTAILHKGILVFHVLELPAGE